MHLLQELLEEHTTKTLTGSSGGFKTNNYTIIKSQTLDTQLITKTWYVVVQVWGHFFNPEFTSITIVPTIRFLCIMCVGQLHNHLVVDHKAELADYAKYRVRRQELDNPIIIRCCSILASSFKWIQTIPNNYAFN